MAGVTEKVLPHLESMQPNSTLDRGNDIEKYDRLAPRNYGLSDKQGGSSSLNVKVLTGGGTIFPVKQPDNPTPRKIELEALKNPFYLPQTLGGPTPATLFLRLSSERPLP
jgi:hypothetical protein